MDNDHALNVQNGFFNQLRKDRTRVMVTLSTGQKISGVVKSFDKFTFLLDTRSGEQMVFKHAVCTIASAGTSAEADDLEGLDGAAGGAPGRESPG